ncbi:MAG TPA: protein kinase [Patescibacteria group bacterium]|nr:protein kinase [Patescibacteria group bacterium]
MPTGCYYRTVDIQKIAHYRIVRLLGSGGMGEVYLAEDTELERSVALKVMSAELAKDPNQRKRFRAEAKAASGLVHPNVCVIHEVGETEDGRPFLAMEYVQGQTLDSLVHQRRFKVNEIVKLGLEMAEALEVAHSFGIVHRDIKAANIIVDRRGVAKVLDFGLAKRFTEDELAASTSSAPQTRTGMLIGTPHYMSPEQALGRELDPRSDLFSLGIVLYELSAGQRPFLGATVGEVINNVINQRPEPLTAAEPSFPSSLERVIAKCLEKDPGNRYASAKFVVEALRGIQRQLEQEQSAKVLPPASGSVPAPTTAAPIAVAAKQPRPTPVFAIASVIVILAVLIGLVVYLKTPGSFRGPKFPVSQTGVENSVAVLPFDNFSSESDTEYLSDGLTEEITTALSRLPGLKVVARNSAFAFKGRKEDARKIGSVLQVSKLLEGSIQKIGKRIHVNAELINVADGFRLWSETYDRSIDDVLQVQEEIARRIAERLQGTPGPQLPQHKTINPEAYKFYLQALTSWNKRTEPGLKKAIQFFQAAIQQQPDYAEAYAGLAATYHVLPEYSGTTTLRECAPLARAAANRALELDPACAQAHAVLGGLQSSTLARDYKGAEEHFRRAMELDPNYATAHHWYGRYLILRGDFDKARSEFETAIDLDPLSPAIRTTMANWYYMKKDFDRSIEEARKVVAAFPEFPPARVDLVMCYFLKHDYEQALREIDGIRALQPDDPLLCLEMRGFALARLGRIDEARQILNQLDGLCAQGKPLHGASAFVYFGLREYDKSLQAFDTAIDREGVPDEILCDPLVAEFKDVPGFQALLKKLGVDQTRF